MITKCATTTDAWHGDCLSI